MILKHSKKGENMRSSSEKKLIILTVIVVVIIISIAAFIAYAF